MKNNIYTLIAFVAILLLPGSIYSQGKIGYIDSEQIFERFEEFRFARQKFEQDAANAEKDLQKLWAQLDSLQIGREKGRFTWSTSRLAEKDNEIAGKQNMIRISTENIFGPGGTIYKSQRQLSQKAMDDIILALAEIALEEGYDIVLDAARGSIPYKKSEDDLTEKVVERLRTGVGKTSGTK